MACTWKLTTRDTGRRQPNSGPRPGEPRKVYDYGYAAGCGASASGWDVKSQAVAAAISHCNACKR
jgi:hypothetical protein